jgi:NRPS condensation-like uncharacterized protein
MKSGRIPAAMSDVVKYVARSHAGNCIGNCVLSLSGRIDESRLHRAVRLAMDVEPILGCRLVPHWFRPYWERRSDLDERPLCEVVEGDQASDAFARFLVETLDPVREPVLRVVVFRGATDTVCLKAPEEVGDGPSMARMIPLLFATYRRLATQPDYVPPAGAPGSRQMLKVASQFGLRQRLRILQGLRALRAAPDATWLFPEPRGPKEFVGYVMLKLPPERVRALSGYGRQRRATMTSVMLAGVYMAARKMFTMTRDDVVTFFTTTDLRRFLPRDRRDTPPSSISGAGRFQLDPGRDRDFDTALASIRDQLKVILKDPARVANRLTALGLALPEIRFAGKLLPVSLFGRAMERRVAHLASVPERQWGLANLGVVDAESMDLGEVAVEDAFATGPIFFWPALTMAFFSFRANLTLSVGVSGRVIDEPVVRRLLEQVDCELPFHSLAPGRVLTVAPAPLPRETTRPAASTQGAPS